jgi:hypothetical protein
MPTHPLLPAPEPAGSLLAAGLFSSIYWHLPILIVVISLVYSATRYDEWGLILREALRWGLRLALFLLLIGVVLFGLASWIG